MNLTTFSCIYLMSCFASKEPIDLPNCPQYCKCYSAHEGGYGPKTSYSVYCTHDTPTIQYDLTSVKDLPLNTVILENFIFSMAYKDKYFKNMFVKNLVLKVCVFDYIMLEDDRLHLFDEIDASYLEVLTILFTKLTPPSDERPEFEWKLFAKFVNLKAIHIENGLLVTIDHKFRDLSANNVISVTLKQNILSDINEHSFDDLKSLKMLTITQNLIKDLDFLTTDGMVWADLWLLDVRQNLIQSFPQQLVETLPALKVLKLGQNYIRVIDSQTISILLNRCREFHFDKLPGPEDRSGGHPESALYFNATQDMQWIPKYYHSDIPFQKSPYFFYESLKKMNCRTNDLTMPNVTCYNLDSNQYDYCPNRGCQTTTTTTTTASTLPVIGSESTQHQSSNPSSTTTSPMSSPSTHSHTSAVTTETPTTTELTSRSTDTTKPTPVVHPTTHPYTRTTKSSEWDYISRLIKVCKYYDNKDVDMICVEP